MNQIEYNAAGMPVNTGLYDPVYEHDSCGTGFVARIDATADHSIVEKGIRVLINLEHRGAVGGDKSTGDGAGLTIQVPHLFFQSHFKERGINLPDSEDYAAGMVFLPAAAQLRDSCKKAFERIVNEEGCEFISWRSVPVNNKDLGVLAKSTQPDIEQIFIARGKTSRDLFELRLYIIRRRAEKEIAAWKNFDTSQFYIASLSSRTIVYKGLLTGSQIPVFYPDLNDPSFKSPFSLIHQRYSTNTLPTWNLAQPFRYIGHNGEINTLRGNINRMRTRESILASGLFGEDIEKIKPVVVEGGSDSAIFDNVLELLVIGGRSIPHAMMMMIPEAYGPRIEMSEDKYAFYEFHSSIMEPWDGPAAMIFTDGRYIGGTLDRNGLRPARYTINRDGLIVMASETGVLDFPAENILRRGRLQPGRMFLVDLIQKRIVPDKEIKSKISRQRPYRRWCNSNRISLRGLFSPSRIPAEDAESLIRKQVAFGYTEEELKMVISPMVSTGQEAIGSMGNDAALAVLSERSQLLFSYFKQLFAQVTNPPIDPLREEMVMSLESYVGRESNLLEEKPQYFRGLKLPHPVLTPRDIRRIREAERKDLLAKDIDILFPAGKDGTALYAALEIVFEKAKAAIHSGASILILTDRNLDRENCPIPSLLAIAGLNHYLINNGLRNYAGIIVETGEAREVMHFALLVAYGADAICPYLAFSTIRDLALNNMYDRPITPEEAIDSYITAIKKGLLKTLSRMGISTIHSFFGSQIFEAVGINSTIINKYICGTASRIEGIGYDEIAQEVYIRHNRAFPQYGNAPKLLDIGGIYHQRINGEKHHWSANSIYLLQWATRTDNYQIFKQYTKTVNDDNNKITLRSLLHFKQRKPIPLDQVEPVEDIIKRFSTSPMSFGSISREAHETLAIAMNSIGARSNSGEGGEDPARFKKLANGDNKNSRVKQVASGRFGVTTEYLVSADELQIKMAQGAKPGEGGQLPGHKVNDEIARVRHTMPGVTLISPPPHHDIYSIEDLAQLIYDLKTVNPDVRVSVKLVSEVGVGTIAAGVAKAKADLVVIAGHDGGTGASPLTAIKHTGLPWELGLAETQHTLITNRLRDRIRIQVDGLLKTGRDLAIAALLGAEEFGFGTSALVVLGCVMMRKCHLNTCPVGVATQDPKLRAKFQGKPEYVERYMRFLASELREYMAELGFRKLDDMIGHVELLEVNPEIKNHWKAKTLNLDKILSRVSQGKNTILRSKSKTKSMLLESFDSEIIEKCIPAIKNKKSFQINLPIRNIHRAAGAMLSGKVVKKYGAKGLPEDTIKLNFKGSAGQSFGAFLAPGITMRLEGDANDYLAKGMSGGKIIVVPDQDSTFAPHENVIVGNVVLYGATGGEVYINGIAGERFAIRNSGAKAVVEGVGDHCCEYMTGGIIVVIGNTGNNFAAGMSGGIAYVYDESQLFDTHCNLDMVDVEYVWNEEDKVQIRTMIEKHYSYTDSPRAKKLLSDWDTHLPLFVKVMPIDYRKSLERMKLHEDTHRETVSATEEVYSG